MCDLCRGSIAFLSMATAAIVLVKELLPGSSRLVMETHWACRPCGGRVGS